ncbi:unnamed protein product [Polarella glacialis]|uniref:Uncharacterized protein n=1 Tax=Polarella glacialis TaxID=89957 RepID=A0A813GZ10_POLGL|nr:unnamed protein product [Polarella glacialis]
MPEESPENPAAKSPTDLEENYASAVAAFLAGGDVEDEDDDGFEVGSTLDEQDARLQQIQVSSVLQDAGEDAQQDALREFLGSPLSSTWPDEYSAGPWQPAETGIPSVMEQELAHVYSGEPWRSPDGQMEDAYAEHKNWQSDPGLLAMLEQQQQMAEASSAAGTQPAGGAMSSLHSPQRSPAQPPPNQMGQGQQLSASTRPKASLQLSAMIPEQESSGPGSGKAPLMNSKACLHRGEHVARILRRMSLGFEISAGDLDALNATMFNITKQHLDKGILPTISMLKQSLGEYKVQQRYIDSMEKLLAHGSNRYAFWVPTEGEIGIVLVEKSMSPPIKPKAAASFDTTLAAAVLERYKQAKAAKEHKSQPQPHHQVIQLQTQIPQVAPGFQFRPATSPPPGLATEPWQLCFWHLT